MARKRSVHTRIRVRLNFLAYPVKSSLGALGRKWGLLVLMNIALGRAERFHELLRRTPGMGKRILAMRLRELESQGFIVRVEHRHRYSRWRLSPKGADVLPVLLTLIHFASKWPEPGTERWGSALHDAREFEVVVHRNPVPAASKLDNGQLGENRRNKVRNPKRSA